MSDEYKKHKNALILAVAAGRNANAAAIVNGIEMMIDLRVGELLKQLSVKLGEDGSDVVPS